MGTYVGGVLGGGAGLSLGVAAATLVVPGVGPIMAIGIAAAALLGLGGAGAGAVVGKAVESELASPQLATEGVADDAKLFRQMLKEGRSLIIVRTDSADMASKAGALLDKYSLATKGDQRLSNLASGLKVDIHASNDRATITIAGRITLREDGFLVKDAVRDALRRGTTNIFLELSQVTYIDSSGIGELVGALTSVRSHQGKLTLLNPSPTVKQMLHITRLSSVFDAVTDDTSAVA
jgi:anti-sigma B factor antagonist